MTDADMHLLDSGRVIGGDAHNGIATLAQLAARSPRKTDRKHADALRRLKSLDDVPAFAAGRDRDQHVSCPSQRVHLAGEDLAIGAPRAPTELPGACFNRASILPCYP